MCFGSFTHGISVADGARGTIEDGSESDLAGGHAATSISFEVLPSKVG